MRITNLTLIKCIVLSVLFIHGFAVANPGETFTWPNNTRAAVALTYDDSLNTQLDHAIPALNKFGFRGTFYTTIDSEAFQPRLSEWKSAASAGHELGNHTLYHPCQGSLPNREWVRPDADLDRYSVTRMVDELRIANKTLYMLDGLNVRTFAYPCGETLAGGKSYIEAIKPLFIAARGVIDATSDRNTNSIDLYRINTYVANDVSGQQMIQYIDQLLVSGGIGTITFHGIGGDHLSVTTQAHDELLTYLHHHKDKIWVDTLRNIILHLNQSD